MKTPLPLRVLSLALALLGAASTARADVTPAALFQDHLVLQAGKPVPIWGQATAAEWVSVAFAGQNVSTTAGADGKWRVTLAPLKVNAQPATLTITGNNTLVLKDVLVGEVWLCSGQSNMEFTLKQTKDAQAEIAAANYPLIRQFRVRNAAANAPADKLQGYWSVCSPTTAGDFTGVGYFFARELSQKLGNVPVCLIHSSWGGTEIEAWMSAGAIARLPVAPAIAERWQKRLDGYPEAKAKYDADEAEEERKVAEAKERGETYKKRWHRRPPNPDGSAHEDKATCLFNAMIYPLTPAAIAGVLWYQGESNAPRANEYRQLFPAMIPDWRAAFGQGNLPFYWVQLPNFRGSPSTPDWVELREAQACALVLPAVAQAVTIDVGEVNDIHPKNKQDVGHRLALLALRDTYRKAVFASGPAYGGVAFKNGGATVQFTEPGRLSVKGPALTGFELAGADKVFKPAAARLEGANTVVVRAAEVPVPTAVRYAWRNAPEASLFNETGLPAAPFRSDSW